jgi:LacI family transcriptional regulator
MARTTIKELALAAGVSTTTVSHALNGTRHVSAATRARIEALAREMDYRPDPIARTLQGQDSLLIGHILSTLDANPFFTRVACGADRHAQSLGYATILSYTGADARAEEAAVRLLLEKRVSGIIFTTPQHASNVELAVSAGVATVMVERPFSVRGAHAVLLDHHGGLRDLTCLLIGQGHRDLAYLGGDFSRLGSHIVERQRLQGFRDAVDAAGLTVPASRIVLVPYELASARSACEQLLSHEPHPTGLVVGSDLLAYGVLQVLYERRLRVPDDISVVSFDDTLGPYMAPPLTEADPANEEIGCKAVELIVQQSTQTSRADRGRGKRVTLRPRIHLRGSTRAVGIP